MKRKLIKPDIEQFPKCFRELFINADIYDSSCSPEAKVFFIDKDSGYFLKTSSKGSLKAEAEITRCFNAHSLAAKVLDYRSLDRDWLLTERVNGEDCTHSIYLDDPKRLCDTTATLLRDLHSIDFTDWVLPNRIESYLETAKNNYRNNLYDLSYFDENSTVEKAWDIVQSGKHLLKADTLIHGDYCLPNIMLDDWNFSGFIDLGNGGIGDRHIDLFWGAWTLDFNLHTDKYRERFFDVYGKDKIDKEILKIISAIEVFG